MSLVEHYEDCFAKHGDTHLGVDWPNAKDAKTRYRSMLEVIRETPDKAITLLDFGCGTSHLYEYMLETGVENVIYSGLDLSQQFIAAAKKKFPDNDYFLVDILDSPDAIPSFDYVIMNGVFTEKRELSFDEMYSFFTEMITAVFEKTRRGIAFNVMSKQVDWERDDLFHLPLDTLASFLTQKVSRNFIIRNDYGLYEYTVYVYK